MKRNDRRGRRARRALLAFGVLAALAAVLLTLWRGGWLNRLGSVEELRALIDQTGAWAGVVYFLLQMMTVIIAPIPSNVTMMAGALALGFWEAVFLGVLAVLAGSLVMFSAARRLGRDAVQRFVDRSVMEKYLPVIEEKQDMFLFLTMLFPFFPDDILCILAGLTTIPLRRFAAIMALARPWGLVFAALVGSGAIAMPAWAWAVLAAPMATVFYLMMKHSAKIEDRLFRACRRISGRRRKKRSASSGTPSAEGKA